MRLSRIILAAMIVVLGLGFAHWRLNVRPEGAAPGEKALLRVGFLPVT